MQDTFNGWTNYATWNIKLQIDNDQSSYEYWKDMAQTCLNNAQADKLFTKEENAINSLRESLKEHFEDEAGQAMERANCTASFITDLLNSALLDVNWQEIAQSLIEDAKGQ